MTTYRRAATSVSPWIDFDVEGDIYIIKGDSVTDTAVLEEAYFWLKAQLPEGARKRRLASLTLELGNLRSDSSQCVNWIVHWLHGRYEKVALSQAINQNAAHGLVETLKQLNIVFEGRNSET